jgi:hypothetical protein
MSTIPVTLAGVEYSVQKPNIGQLRRITKIFNGPAESVSFDVLRVALERAEPKCEDIDQVEAGFDEVAAAAGAILVFAGLKKDEATAGPNGAGRTEQPPG